MVRFEERSIAREDYQFWQPHRFDIIFCRNVIMYLSTRVLGEVIARFARALAPDGFLFLSHAEPLRGISQAFHVEHAQGAFYYVLRKAASESPAGLRSAAWPIRPRPNALKVSLSRNGVTASTLSTSPRNSGSFQGSASTAASCAIAKPAVPKPAPTLPEVEMQAEQRPRLRLGASDDGGTVRRRAGNC